MEVLIKGIIYNDILSVQFPEWKINGIISAFHCALTTGHKPSNKTSRNNNWNENVRMQHSIFHENAQNN